MGSISENPRTSLLNSLRGQSLVVPDFQKVLQHWPNTVSPELERLEKDVSERLEYLFPDPERLAKLKASKFAFFAASWWPYAPFEKLRIAAYLGIWLFAWDDEIDSKEFTSIVDDVGQGQAFRSDTLRFIRKSLSLSDEKEESGVVTKYSNNPVITNFEPVGIHVAQSCTERQVKLFYDEITLFLNMCDVEQNFQMEERLPSIQEYNNYRAGSGAVGVCLAMTEYCFSMEIPEPIMLEADAKTLWDETNLIVCVMNDVLSIKKEVAQGQVDTLVPLLYLKHGSLEAAVDDVMEMLQESIRSFEAAAQNILNRHKDDAAICEKLQKFIYGCQCACTANIEWSLETGRYKLDRKSLREGIPVKL